MKSCYEITFDTKKGGLRSWVIHIEANTRKEAKAIAEENWSKHHASHMFHVSVRRLRDDEEFLWHWFHERIEKFSAAS